MLCSIARKGSPVEPQATPLDAVRFYAQVNPSETWNALSFVALFLGLLNGPFSGGNPPVMPVSFHTPAALSIGLLGYFQDKESLIFHLHPVMTCATLLYAMDKPDPQNELTETIQVRMSPRLKRMLQGHADSMGCKASTMARMMIMHGCGIELPFGMKFHDEEGDK